MPLASADIDEEDCLRVTLCVRTEKAGHREHLVPLVGPIPPFRHVMVEICSVFRIFVEEVPELNVVGVEEWALILWPGGKLMDSRLAQVLR